MKRVLSAVFAGALLLVLTAAVAGAQGATAQIGGTVRDSSGGVLPGADVTVTQTDTGFKRSVVSGSDGSFAVPGIPIGPYQLEVSFKNEDKNGARLFGRANACRAEYVTAGACTGSGSVMRERR